VTGLSRSTRSDTSKFVAVERLKEKCVALVIALGTPKGGSGKSTLCLLLAEAYTALGWPVRILDADPQGTALQWSKRRLATGDASDISVVDATGEDNFLARLKEAQDHTIVLIDLPGVLSATAPSRRVISSEPRFPPNWRGRCGSRPPSTIACPENWSRRRFGLT
jgi:adenylate kinase family enzyme